MEEFILILYFLALLVLLIFGFQGFLMVYYFLKSPPGKERSDLTITDYPTVTIQLPIYNEVYVVSRLIRAACRIQYP